VTDGGDPFEIEISSKARAQDVRPAQLVQHKTQVSHAQIQVTRHEPSHSGIIAEKRFLGGGNVPIRKFRNGAFIWMVNGEDNVASARQASRKASVEGPRSAIAGRKEHYRSCRLLTRDRCVGEGVGVDLAILRHEETRK